MSDDLMPMDPEPGPDDLMQPGQDGASDAPGPDDLMAPEPEQGPDDLMQME